VRCGGVGEEGTEWWEGGRSVTGDARGGCVDSGKKFIPARSRIRQSAVGRGTGTLQPRSELPTPDL
jgi:hypothetical protein